MGAGLALISAPELAVTSKQRASVRRALRLI